MNLKTLNKKLMNFLNCKAGNNYLLVFLFLIPINVAFSQQCGYPNDVQVVNYQVANRNYSEIGLRIQVYAIMNENGTKGVTKTQADISMAKVAQDFLINYGIIINYCVREIRSNYVYNFEHFNIPPTCESHIYFRIHENCRQNTCGEAGLGG